MLVEFLKLVLPTQGYKCWVEINRHKKVTQGFVPTIEELAAKVLEINARGSDAYYALAGFATDRNRRGANAGWFKCFWADVDCGKGKPHATTEDALAAVDECCDRYSLPIPGIVKSGNGLHAYWPFYRDINRDEWLPVAERFKLLCVNEFQADPTRTADAASILRPPQTKNYKDPFNPRDVELHDLEDFYPTPIESIDSALCNNPSVSAIKKQVVNSPLPVSNSLNLGLPKTFDAEAAVAEGGRNAAVHAYACSLRRKGFSEEDTYIMALEYSQTKCAPPLSEDESRKAIASGIKFIDDLTPPAPVKEEELPKLPYGFRWKDGALYHDAKDEDGKIIPHCLSDSPLFMKGLANREGDKQENCSIMRVHSAHKGWQEFTLNMEQVYSNEWRAEVSKRGGTINSGKDKFFKTFMIESERVARKMAEITQYRQLGWKRDFTAYLAGNVLYTANGQEKAIGTPKLQAFMDFGRPRGTREGWQAPAQKFTIDGAEANLALLVASFAAPLIPFCLDAGNGGCVLSMRSEDSGYGKTPTIQAMSSVWGEMSACRVTGKYTWNRSQEELVRRCHQIQIEEEMPMNDGTVVARHMKDFTDGTSKGRLNSKGEIVGEPEYYQTILASMSNISLYDLVKLHDEPISHRIFEISPNKPPPEFLSNLGGITRDMGLNCGLAGPWFMQVVMQPKMMQWVIAQLRGVNRDDIGLTQKKYRELLKSTSADRYVVALLSAIDVTARVLNAAGILEFSVDRLMNYLLEAAKPMTVGEPEATDIPTPIKKLTRFLNMHWQNVLVVPGPHLKGQVLLELNMPKSEVFMRRERNTDTLYIDQEPLGEWCTDNKINMKKLGAELKELGVVLGTSVQMNLGGGVMGVSTGRSYCWKVNMAHDAIAHTTEIVQEGAKVYKLVQ